MKKKIKITTGQLQQIIKEGVAKLHKQALIENRIKQINEELEAVYPKKINEIGFGQDGNPYGFDNDYSEEAIIQFDREYSDNPDEYIDPRIFSQIDEEDVSDNEIQYHDLFEYYEEQPVELKKIVNKYLTMLDDVKSYETITKFHDEVYKIGYTFDSGLDAEPYGLRPIGVKLNQLKGWEDDESDISENKNMKKTVQITTRQLQQIIKEGVAKLHKKALIENRIKQINEELNSMNEVFYGDSDGDYDFDKSEKARAEELYNKGLELFNNGDTSGAEELRKQALKIGSWLSWGEEEFPPYTNKSFDDMMGNPLDNMDFLDENSEVASPEIMQILNGYLEAALWTEEDEIGHATIEEDISSNSKIDAYKDVKNFMSQAGDLLDEIEPEQIGHDLWLTRNGHGAGFWDRGLGEIGDKLTAIAKGMGSKSVYVGDDGKIYID